MQEVQDHDLKLLCYGEMYGKYRIQFNSELDYSSSLMEQPF